jgi:hypothetical protein
MNRERIPSFLAALVGLFALGAAMGPRNASAEITAVWANSGDEKVTQDELRATSGSTSTISRAWDGNTIDVFGARNEVVAFNLVLEAAGGASDVAVSFDSLIGPAGASIKSAAATGNGVFDWTRRNIELFYVRYVPIRGLSLVANETFDERLIPYRLRRPWSTNLFSGKASGSGLWNDRPDHDKYYPEIAVPLELNPKFDIAPRSNQSIWVDVYIPKGSAPGVYLGAVRVSVKGSFVRSVPVRLTVRKFTLPDVPSAKTMLAYSSSNINNRILGNAYPNPGTAQAAKASRLRDRYFMLAHRHRISLIGDALGSDCADPGDQPCADWLPRLNGSLFTAANGYAGPGVNTGNNVYSVGTYSSWSWKTGTKADMWAHTNRWADWFAAHSPSTEYFLYLIDESSDDAQIEQWSQWMLGNPGAGKRMKSFATLPLPRAASRTPDLDIPASTLSLGVPAQWAPLADKYTHDARKRFYMYNGHRPGSGSFATEDDGVALRELAWGQYKQHVSRWFYWESTYYSDYQGGTGDTDLFAQAQTYGGKSTIKDPDILGQTTGTYGNGDGVLLYPGTDTAYPKQSYGVDGPFASLRLKYWRRGIQDADYLALAATRNPAAVDKIVNQMVPKVLWEYGVHNPNDPTYQYTDVSWPTDADAWENARASLAAIIESAAP